MVTKTVPYYGEIFMKNTQNKCIYHDYDNISKDSKQMKKKTGGKHTKIIKLLMLEK